MENNKLLQELYEKVCKIVVNKNDVFLGLNNFVYFTSSTSSSYYKDIISCKVVYDKLKESNRLGLVSESESHYLEDFFGRYVITLYKKVVEEQKSKGNESVQVIMENIGNLIQSFLQAEDNELKKGFLNLISNNHIYNESEYYYYLGKNYSEITEYQGNIEAENEIRFGIYEIIKKVLLEKKILHNEVIIKSRYQFKLLDTIFNEILDGNILEVLNKLEIKSKLILDYCKKNKTAIFNSKGSKIDVEYFWQKVVSYIFRYNQFTKKQMGGTLNYKEAVVKELGLIKDIFLYIEESLIEGDDFLFKDYIDEQNKKFELEHKEIQLLEALISNSETEKALDFLITRFKNTESEVLNDLIILKSRFKENERNKMLGLDFDEKMANKVNYGVLKILKEYKNYSQQ